MPSPDSLKIGITEPGLPELSVAELEIFRDEIRKLYETRKSNPIIAAHFNYPFPSEEIFKLEDLGAPEFKLWTDFKVCHAKEKSVSYCLAGFRNYRRQRLSEKETSLARSGLESYIGNKLTIMGGYEEIEKREKEKKENEGGG